MQRRRLRHKPGPVARLAPMSAARTPVTTASGGKEAPKAGEEELERKAVEELLSEAKRGKTRAETMGPMGWIKCPLVGANKRFLINTIRNTVPSQRRHDEGSKEDQEDSEPSHSKKEEHPNEHRSHPYKHSSRSRRSSSHSPSRSKNSKDKHDQRYRKR